MRIRRLMALALGLLAVLRGASSAQTIGVPDVSGDQLLYFYDARTSRVPFLSVANPSDETLFIDVAFYPQDLASRLGGGVIEIGPAANRVIDPTSDFGGAANGNAGLAVFTPIQAFDDPTPVVPPEPIVGGFTLANTQLGSGFGENPFARLAVTSSGARAAPGATVDGSAVSYERFAPEILTIPVYFNPQTLGSPESDGNRVVLVSFADEYGTPFELSGRSDTAEAYFFDASGFALTTTSVAVEGVLATSLQAIAGGPNVLSGSGKVFFDVDPGSGSTFGLFSQSLGTFASGQRMPEVFAIPSGNTSTPSVTPTPTRTPGVTLTPTPVETVGAGLCVVTATVTFDAADAAGVTVTIPYPSGASIPVCCEDPAVLARVDNLTGLDSGLFSASDNDESKANPILTVGLVSLSDPIPSGAFARIRFDCTESRPPVGDFSCTADVSNLLGETIPAQCSLSLQ